MKAKLIKESQRLVRIRKGGKKLLLTETIPAGTLIDHPKAFWLCLQGQAIPADKECEQRCGMTPEHIEAASKAYDLLSAGISPDDYDAYERGLMVGYKPDGKKGDTWRHGPKWFDGCEDQYYGDEEDEYEDE